MFNIVTAVAVDTDKEDEKVLYPQIGALSAQSKRELYWKAAAVFCWSSLRCNPGAKHRIFTNDSSAVVLNKIDLKNRLGSSGVEIRYLPFQLFKSPPEIKSSFRNAYFKLDVIAELGKENNQCSILLDSDCLWIKANPDFNSLILSGELLLLDIYRRSSDPFQKSPHNLSMKDMGELFKQIDPSYLTEFPVWYGGEVIAASSEKFKKISEHLVKLNEFLVKQTLENKMSFCFSNGKTMFDGDEYLSSFVHNSLPYPVTDLNPFIRRLWTGDIANNVTSQALLDLTIWHLPAEKDQGLLLLFDEALEPGSSFWKVPMEEFPAYLGDRVGVPLRKYRYQNPEENRPFRKIKRLVRRLLNAMN